MKGRRNTMKEEMPKFCENCGAYMRESR